MSENKRLCQSPWTSWRILYLASQRRENAHSLSQQFTSGFMNIHISNGNIMVFMGAHTSFENKEDYVLYFMISKGIS